MKCIKVIPVQEYTSANEFRLHSTLDSSVDFDSAQSTVLGSLLLGGDMMANYFAACATNQPPIAIPIKFGNHPARNGEIISACPNAPATNIIK
jgi:hypothetical protein